MVTLGHQNPNVNGNYGHNVAPKPNYNGKHVHTGSQQTTLLIPSVLNLPKVQNKELMAHCQEPKNPKQSAHGHCQKPEASRVPSYLWPTLQNKQLISSHLMG
jgi:hypothetical protein